MMSILLDREERKGVPWDPAPWLVTILNPQIEWGKTCPTNTIG